MGNGTNANPDETFMIAAFDFVFKCGKNCFTMRIGPLKLISISRVMSSRLPALSWTLISRISAELPPVPLLRSLYAEIIRSLSADVSPTMRLHELETLAIGMLQHAAPRMLLTQST